MATHPPLNFGSLLRFRFVRHQERFYESAGARKAMVLLWMLALACAVGLNRYTPWFQSASAQVGLGLLFGGSASNMVDVLRQRYVADFIDLGWWPVFNLADAAIVAGLMFALLF